MEILSILLKLMPFTHKYQDGTVGWAFFDLNFGDVIVTSVEVCLIGIFGIFLWLLISSYLKDKKNIKFLNEQLIILQQNKFSNYNDFLNELKSKSPKLSAIWREFDESLIKQDGRYENSLDADYFFNEKSLISVAGSKLYSAIPGILLGIGLLGTFFALYVALIELNLDGDELKNSIKVFIGMVGIKFTASVWGVFLSVVFTLFEKGCENSLVKKVYKLQDKIDEIFKRQTAEQNLAKIAIQSQDQTMALNSLAETLTQKISEQFNPMLSQINQNLVQMPIQISNAIGESLASPLSEISEHTKNIVSSQSDNLESIVHDFVDKLDQTTGNQIDGVQNMMTQTTNELTNLVSTIKDISQEQNEKMFAREVEIQKLFTLATDSFENQVDSINKTVNMLDEKHNEIFDKHIAFANKLENITLKVLSEITKKAKETKEIIDISSQKLSAVPSMLDKFENSSDTLEKFAITTNEATKIFKESVKDLELSQENIKDQIEELSLQATMTNHIATSTKEITNSSENTAKTLQETYKNLINENSDNVDKLGESMSKWLSDYDRQVQSTMQNSLNEIQKSLANFANVLTSSIGSLEDAIETIDEKIR